MTRVLGEKKRRWAVLLVGAVLGLSSASQAGSAPPQLRSLRLIPQDRTLWGAKASQHFLVIGKYSDGLERDVTAESRFSISDSKVAKVDAEGRVVALADGSVVLTVSLEGRSVKTDVRVEGSQETRPFSFARDIGGILTKRGCNDSSCHGGVKGKGGFKLSLNALYARDDYQWIVEGGTFQVLTTEAGEKIPRINLKEPEKSLLLMKATMGVSHGGGQPLRPNLADYETILNWVRNGVPYGEEGDKEGVRVVRVEVEPREVVLAPEGKHRLLVTAHLSNGQQEDISDQVLYASNNSEVVKVDEQGQVAAVRTGETSVMVRASGFAVSARVGVVAKPIARYPKVPHNNFIDDHVFAKLKKFNIIPSQLSSDTEFLRRVCLDLTGTLPPPSRVRKFAASKNRQKRQKVVEVLLNTPEFIDYWTFRFADLFRVTRYANQIDSRSTHVYQRWIRASIAANKPYDQIAHERIVVQGAGGASSHYFPASEVRNPEEKMSEQVRVFLGRRFDCAQCHNHPFEAWSQDQFWGLTAFFGRMNGMKFGPQDYNLYGSVLYDDPAGQEVDYAQTGRSRFVTHPRTKAVVQPTFLDGRELPEAERADLRWKLAEWMTSHPYFAEAAVNRMWGYFFGKGIVDAVDDFRSTNPPTHPDLLKALAKDFRERGHDLKHLMRTIVNSRTYQLSSVPNETNADDQINYSHFLPRQLDSEVLLDAISSATGVPETFRHKSNQNLPGTLPTGSRAIHMAEPDIFPVRFLEAFGAPTRMAVPERKNESNLQQALHMLAGATYTEKLSKKGGRVDRLLKSGASDAKIIEELYLAALSRFPSEAEQKDVQQWIRTKASRPEAIRSLAWAVISSREFVTNH